MSRNHAKGIVAAAAVVLCVLLAVMLVRACSLQGHVAIVEEAAKPPAPTTRVSVDDAENPPVDSATVEPAPPQPEPEAVPQPDTSLIVESDPALYTYEDLSHDVAALAARYPAWVHADSIGVTADGRALHHLVIGNPQAPTAVLVHAGIHAREYITTQLVMRQAAAFLAQVQAGDAYGALAYADVLESVAIHVVPSVNPDGAALCYGGLEALQTDNVRARVEAIAASDGEEPDGAYFSQWKANANGVDLNRNFDALWDDYEGSPVPSAARYKGTSPGSEPEAAALIALTEQYGFARTISYHTSGSVVYWYFGQEGNLYDKTLSFANAVAAETGYGLDADYENLDPAGYKDWCLLRLGIPSLTVEVGRGSSPVSADEFAGIYRENEHIFEVLAGM